jgi:uncharacterized protein YbjQ (UPF0145 family)
MEFTEAQKQALQRMIALARELAAEGPATRKEDCSAALNEMTLLALRLAGETAAQHGPGWEEG